MPGNTPLGLPYPLAGEKASGAAKDVQALAEAADAALKNLFDDVDGLRRLPCGMANGGTQQVVSGVSTRMQLVTEVFDTVNMVDLVTEPFGITVQEDGLYLCSAYALWQTNATGTRTVSLMKNDAIVGQCISPAPTSSWWGISYTSATFAVAGDIFRVAANHTVGTVNSTVQSVTSSQIAAFRISS